jgi:hypothetical protein
MLKPTRIPFFGVDRSTHYVYGLSLENRTNFLELRSEAIDLLEQSKREGVNVAQLFDDKDSPFCSLVETCLGYSNIALKSIDLAMALLFVIGDENSPGLIMELNFPKSDETNDKGEELPEGVHPEMANRAALWSHVENPEVAQRMAREEPWNELSQILGERSRQVEKATKNAGKPSDKIDESELRKDFVEMAASGFGSDFPSGFNPLPQTFDPFSV